MIADLPVAFADADASSLRWRIGGPRRPALASVAVPMRGGGRLELSVLGSSHQVVVTDGGESFSETVACERAGGDPLPSGIRRATRAGTYRFSSHVSRMDAAGLRDAVAGITGRLAARADALVARFPGQPEAVTALEPLLAPAAIGWRTWHVYPQTGDVVATETIIEVRR